jgi:hypothetical protein
LVHEVAEPAVAPRETPEIVVEFFPFGFFGFSEKGDVAHTFPHVGGEVDSILEADEEHLGVVLRPQLEETPHRLGFKRFHVVAGVVNNVDRVVSHILLAVVENAAPLAADVPHFGGFAVIERHVQIPENFAKLLIRRRGPDERSGDRVFVPVVVANVFDQGGLPRRRGPYHYPGATRLHALDVEFFDFDVFHRSLLPPGRILNKFFLSFREMKN